MKLALYMYYTIESALYGFYGMQVSSIDGHFDRQKREIS